MAGGRRKWRFAIDRGGTFTDVVGVDPDGRFHSLKVLSSSALYEDASIEGIRRLLSLETTGPLPADRIECIRFGTTVATNALLERKGCRVALLTTKGFRDLLEIGYQNRPDIFKLCIGKPLPLYSGVIEIDERMDGRGNVVKRPDIPALETCLSALPRDIDAVAVVLMHAWINPAHELLCEAILRQRGLGNVFLSHRAINLIKVVSRGQSAVVDAYLSVELARYLKRIEAFTRGIRVEFMQSCGTLTSAASFLGKNSILSGPAGGVIAVAETAAERGIRGAIGFDMGGTSTDVSRFDGTYEKIYEQVIAGVPLQAEMLSIVTVAAGGGSILSFDGQSMKAGPESAGSAPGPACYGFGGPLTVTDANLLTGRIVPSYFPRSFGMSGDRPLDEELVRRRFAQLTLEINAATGMNFSASDIANGFLKVSNEKMAMAIREISISRGFDVRDYVLVCFGGAGGQHACAIARLLDIGKIILHPLASVMSAYGIGLAKQGRKAVKTLLRPYNRALHEELPSLFALMEEQLLPEMEGKDGRVVLSREIDLRPSGAEAFLTLEYAGFEETETAFRKLYESLFGFAPYGIDIEAVNIRSEVVNTDEYLPPYSESRRPAGTISPVSYREVFYPEGSVGAPVFEAESLPAGAMIEGPALIVEPNSTIVIDPGFRAEVDTAGIITLSRTADGKALISVAKGRPDPILLEVFNNLFMGVATEMGVTLKKTAHSVNMKERLDFSCALFDRHGDLVANAPHIPVHLGSMADAVKAVSAERADTMRPGDIYLTNNPYKGGSHLPDMTVICPVFSDEGELIFFTAARGHHADVGGATPGSMPPSATDIVEEGVLIDNFLLVRKGFFREEELKAVLSAGPWPVRNIPERTADFRAQIAACHQGMKEVRNIISRYGLVTVLEYMKHIQDNAEYSVKISLTRFLKQGAFHGTFEDRLDDGSVIAVSVDITGGDDPPRTVAACIDFTGTAGQHIADNLNAPESVTRSAVMYVLRALLDTEIPLNSGCLRPVEIVIPGGTILSPVYPAPVASGNVETSQRIVDVLLGALNLAAASQGTMNNLLFEVDGEMPYYETIAGGAGALEGCPGASGVQVHMTNTRITDPEVIEVRHPGVRIERFSLRKDSGGKGKFRGGDGVTREIRFLKPATVSILSERRVYAPYGLEGGGPGEKGKNFLRRADGSKENLGHRAVIRVAGNESVIIKTPGGGAYGEEEAD